MLRARVSCGASRRAPARRAPRCTRRQARARSAPVERRRPRPRTRACRRCVLLPRARTPREGPRSEGSLRSARSPPALHPRAMPPSPFAQHTEQAVRYRRGDFEYVKSTPRKWNIRLTRPDAGVTIQRGSSAAGGPRVGKRTSIKRRDFLRLSAMAGAGAFVAACVPGATSATPKPSTDTSKLVIALDNLGAQNWRPWLTSSAEDSIRLIVGDPLILADPKTRDLVPALAESWTVSADRKTYNFKLRANVPFHGDWGTLTAEEVKFTWEQYVFHPEQTHGFIAEVMKAAVGGSMNGFTVVSPLEFKVTTSGTPAH